MILLSWITGSAEVSEATYTFFIVRLSGLLLWLFVLLFFFVCFFLRIIFFVFIVSRFLPEGKRIAS
jgi:hypothetical protein